MPNYYPNYVNYPNTTPNPYSYASAPTQPPQQQTFSGIQWVDGEVGAKAFQMPQGWPVGTPIALWDTNDQTIYLKSFNQMGMPNPLQKIHYTMEETPAGYLPQVSSSAPPAEQNPNYVTKEDLNAFKNEIRELLKNRQPNNNRGGNT